MTSKEQTIKLKSMTRLAKEALLLFEQGKKGKI